MKWRVRKAPLATERSKSLRLIVFRGLFRQENGMSNKKETPRRHAAMERTGTSLARRISIAPKETATIATPIKAYKRGLFLISREEDLPGSLSFEEGEDLRKRATSCFLPCLDPGSHVTIAGRIRGEIGLDEDIWRVNLQQEVAHALLEGGRHLEKDGEDARVEPA